MVLLACFCLDNDYHCLRVWWSWQLQSRHWQQTAILGTELEIRVSSERWLRRSERLLTQNHLHSKVTAKKDEKGFISGSKSTAFVEATNQHNFPMSQWKANSSLLDWPCHALFFFSSFCLIEVKIRSSLCSILMYKLLVCPSISESCCKHQISRMGPQQFIKARDLTLNVYTGQNIKLQGNADKIILHKR